MLPPKPKRVKTDEAAAWLDIPKTVLWAHVRAGRIKVIKVGRDYLFTEAELLRYDREREVYTK